MVADVLRGAGDVVVVWGERVASGERGGQALEALLALADALGVADRPESGLIEVPSSTNVRGLREVGCLPNLGPGLADAPATGMSAAEIAAADGPGALLLVERELPADRLAGAASVIAFAHFRSEALDEHADVVFPAEVYPEKEGTVTHPDGRVQRVRQALGRANEVLPGWQVLAELCERCGAGLDVMSAAQVSSRVAEAVPLYSDLTLEEIGGEGVRWQDREAASALPAAELSSEPLPGPPPAPEGMRAVTVPSLWSGPEVEHSPSLAFLAPGAGDRGGPAVAHADLSPADARRLGISHGDEIELSVGGTRATATAALRTGVPEGSIIVRGAALPDGPVELGAPARAGVT